MSYRGRYYGDTTSARQYIEERDAADQVERRNHTEGGRLMACGLTSYQWLEHYFSRRKPLGNGHQRNEESNHDHQDGREATGPQAAEGRAGEGVGDAAPQQEAASAAGSGWTEGAPKAQSLDWTKGDPIPF